MSITSDGTEATRATLRQRVWYAFREYARERDNDIDPAAIHSAGDACTLALDALGEFERAEAQAELPCAEVNCYVERYPEMYAGNPHRICEAHEARQLLRAIIDKVKGEA